MQKDGDTIRVLIADSQPIFRDGLRMLLEAHEGYNVVGAVGDAAEATRLTLLLKPDILLLDLAMPYHPGLEALREFASSSAEVRILVFAATIEKGEILEALQLGARGVLLKQSTTQLLHKSIRSVIAGQCWLGRESVSDVAGALEGLGGSLPRRAQRKFGLTPRELEIASRVVAGYSNKEIAQKLCVSEQTVKHHLTNIFDKLGVYSRLELALFVVHHRLLGDMTTTPSPVAQTE